MSGLTLNNKSGSELLINDKSTIETICNEIENDVNLYNDEWWENNDGLKKTTIEMEQQSKERKRKLIWKLKFSTGALYKTLTHSESIATFHNRVCFFLKN